MMMSIGSQMGQFMERKRSQEALAENQTLFLSFMNHIPGTAFIKDEQGRYLYTNPVAEKLVNCQPQELIGKTDFDILPAEVAQQVRENEMAVLAADEPRESVEALPQEDGTHYWLSLKFPFKDASGKRRIAGMSFDISDRQRAEEKIAALNKALNHRVNELQTLLAVIPIGIGIAREPDCRDIRVNPAFSEWLKIPIQANGSTSQPNAEQLPYQVYHQGRKLPPQEQPIQYAAAHGVNVRNVELEIVRDDGRVLYLLANAAPLLDEEGQVRGCVGAFLDISERKQAEESLRASEHLYRTLTEVVPNFIWSCDAQGQLDFVNSRWLEYAGMTVEELNAGGLEQVYHPEDVSWVMQQWNLAIYQREPFAAECRYRRKDGVYQWFMVRAVPLKDSEGNLLKWIGITTDIHERKQAEMDLQKSETVLHAFLASSPIGLVFLDRDLRYIHANQALATINGIPLSEHLGRTLWDVLPEWAPQLAPILQSVMQTQEPLLNQEISGELNQPGVHRHCLVSYYPVCLPDGQILGVGVTSMDVTELKRAEQALRESESLFRRMADGAPIFIWMSGLDGHCTYFNQPWLDFVGQTLEEALALGWPDGIHPDDQEYCLETYRSAFNARQRFQVEYRHRRQDGEYRWLLDVGVPLFNDDGRFAGYIGSGIDITDRRQTEQAQHYLAEASRVLSNSLDYPTTLANIAQLTVPDLADWCTVHLIEEDGSVPPLVTAHVNPNKIAWANQMNQKYPFDPNDVRGVAQVLRTGQSELYPDIPDHLLVESARDQEHLQILREVGFKSVMIVPLWTRGRTLGTISFVAAESGRQYDSTDLALAEELARRAALAVENARLYQQAQQARQTAEQAADVTARLQWVTAAFSEALTLAQVAEVVVNQGMAALGVSSGFVALLTDNDTSLEIVTSVGLPENLVDDWKHFSVTAPVPMAELVRTGKPIFLESIAAYATQYPILNRVANLTGNQAFACIPLTVEGRILGGMSFSFAEVTSFSPEDRAFMLTLGHLCGQAIARARLYEAEQRARTQAEAANRIKDEFLAILSHELRSPLNPILGWTRLLRSRKFDEKATDRALEIIERNAKLQTQLIEDLLDVSRILRGKLVLNESPVNLVTLIEAALETVRLAAQTKEIQIQTVFEANVGQVSGDANRLQQVVWNLLSNAIKFTPPQGRVEVRLEQVGSQVQIHVRDTGKGISPEFLPYVFEYFRQENSSTTRQFGGLGLGLAIVRYLTELHGGSVHAESAGEGLGSTFTVTLPLMAKAVEVAPEPISSQGAADLDGLRILVVDDETDIRELVAFILEQSGAEVTVAASAEEALVALNQSVPDVLLSDIGMPDVDGYMLMRQVRTFSAQQGGQIPAIALTAYAGEYNQQQAFQAGFQLHISKPVEPEELVKAIAHLVERG
jgi:PAS domain S-box-containing protein